MKIMNNRNSVIGIISGSMFSVLGFLGTAVVVCAPCTGICISGIAVTIFGVSIAGFLHQFNKIFIIIGSCFFIIGIYSTLKSIKKKGSQQDRMGNKTQGNDRNTLEVCCLGPPLFPLPQRDCVAMMKNAHSVIPGSSRNLVVSCTCEMPRFRHGVYPCEYREPE